MPYIAELIEKLRGSGFFTKLDMASGYWKVAMHPEDIQKTAFVKVKVEKSKSYLTFQTLQTRIKSSSSTVWHHTSESICRTYHLFPNRELSEPKRTNCLLGVLSNELQKPKLKTCWLTEQQNANSIPIHQSTSTLTPHQLESVPY